MPEPRDRLERPVDLDAAFSRIRRGALIDEEETRLVPPLGTGWDRVGTNRDGSGTPRNMNGRGRTALGVLTAEGETQFTLRLGTGLGRGGSGRGTLATPRTIIRRGREIHPTPLARRENTPMAGTATRGRGRGRTANSVLPSWYPRTPLRDISHVVRAIERRRTRLGVTDPTEEGQRTLNTPLTQLRAPIEQDVSLVTPTPSFRKKPCPPSIRKVSKILLSVANKPSPDDSEFLTPQKKLLNEIDTVEKVVMDELNRLKRTPSAKKAEREKRVRTLMSMR